MRLPGRGSPAPGTQVSLPACQGARCRAVVNNKFPETLSDAVPALVACAGTAILTTAQETGCPEAPVTWQAPLSLLHPVS